jgi:hypothetical protein
MTLTEEVTVQVCFDEAGNTGQNLLDDTQQVFTLSSVCMSTEQAVDALAVLTQGSKKPEVHFQDLKRTPKGKEKILRFLEQPIFIPDVVKLSLIHKPFMVTTKIVDLLIETLAHRDGIDLYERGGNIATANLIQAVMPVFVGNEAFSLFQYKFVNMIRRKGDNDVDDFYKFVEALWSANNGKTFEGFLATFLASSQIIDEVLASADVIMLDPAVPSFVTHCGAWGEQLGRQFDVIHDSSKPIQHGKEILEILMSKDEPDVLVGYDIRKSVFPLKATGVQFADSQVLPQLQVADMIASSFGFWGHRIAAGTMDDGFWRELDSLKLARLSVCDIWPSHEVTPKGLGMEEVGGVNAVDYTGDLIQRQKNKRK